MTKKNFPNIEAVFSEQAHPVQKNLRTMAADGENFSKIANALVSAGHRLAWLFGTDDRNENGTFGVHALFAPAEKNEWVRVSAALDGKNPRYPSLTKTIMAAVWYERYLADMFGIIPEGHPDLRRLVHHENVPLGTYPLRKDFAWNTRMKKDQVPYPMVHVEGNGVYEIPVGPIHAGIIEPGHFRFNVVGERIINLEGKLFFTHKGVEKLVEGKSVSEVLPFVERISDDSAAGHALAFAQAVEIVSGTKISEKAALLRTLVAEFERMTMHIHDLSNIAGMGTGYTVMAAQGFRIKEDLVRLSENIFNNRFWRGYIVPGGVVRELEAGELKALQEGVSSVMEDMCDLLKIGLESDGLIERMVTSGVLKPEAARAYGAVGVALRATDQKMDTRKDHPYAAYDRLKFGVITKTGGDVFARYMVRVEELEESFRMVKEILKLLPKAEGKAHVEYKAKKGEAFSAVEGWRGEILHYIRLDEDGLIDRMAVRDPSFSNWPLFGEIGPGNIIPDFPLCNKSLNLSYSGNDL